MKIYDCFTFFNELDLLELRLQQLYESVDHFVIVEATSTFQGNPKKLYYAENESRYAKYKDKIIHVVVDLQNADPWQNERTQRDAIMQGLVNAAPDDIAIISDVDEFIRPEAIATMRASDALVFGLRVPYFNFKFNYMLVDDPESYCTWSTAARIKSLSSPEDLRRSRWVLNQFPYNYYGNEVQMIEHAGWHFTYLGDDEFIRTKIKSFAHSELNTSEVLSGISVEDCIVQGRGFNKNDPRRFAVVDLDDYFPVELQKYKQYVLTGSGNTATQYLPQ